MPIAKPAYWSPVAPLSGIRQFFSRYLAKFTPCLTPPRIYPKSSKAKLKLPFNQADDELSYFGRRFSAGTWPSSVNEWARDVGHGITNDRGLGRRSPPDLHSLTKNILWDTWGPRFSAARHQSSSAGHAIVWSIVFLFAERNFRLCVNRNFDTIFDPVLPEPNRIFGLLNLSIECLVLILRCSSAWNCSSNKNLLSGLLNVLWKAPFRLSTFFSDDRCETDSLFNSNRFWY